MKDSTSTKKNNIIAFRLPPKVIPICEDLAKQAGLIRDSGLNTLAKFSMLFFAEIWLQQLAKIARNQLQMPQQRDPLKQKLTWTLHTPMTHKKCEKQPNYSKY
jgi:hypothetical protein